MHMGVWGSSGIWGYALDISAGRTRSALNATGRVRSGSLRPAREKAGAKGPEELPRSPANTGSA